MQLMTPELEKQFTDIGMQRQTGNPMILTTYYHPSNPTEIYYASEYNAETETFYGYKDSMRKAGEWGYFTLSDLKNNKIQEVGMERDIFHIPQPIYVACPSLTLQPQPRLGLTKAQMKGLDKPYSMSVDFER